VFEALNGGEVRLGANYGVLDTIEKAFVFVLFFFLDSG
jgi:hypothetical protein